MERRQEDNLIAEEFVKLKCYVPMIPVDFGNMTETCSVGACCVERLANPASPQRYSTVYSVHSKDREAGSELKDYFSRSWCDEQL